MVVGRALRADASQKKRETRCRRRAPAQKNAPEAAAKSTHSLRLWVAGVGRLLHNKQKHQLCDTLHGPPTQTAGLPSLVQLSSHVKCNKNFLQSVPLFSGCHQRLPLTTLQTMCSTEKVLQVVRPTFTRMALLSTPVTRPKMQNLFRPTPVLSSCHMPGKTKFQAIMFSHPITNTKTLGEPLSHSSRPDNIINPAFELNVACSAQGCHRRRRAVQARRGIIHFELQPFSIQDFP